MNIKPYDEALKGFKSVCCEANINDYLVTDLTNGEVFEIIQKEKPDMVVAIGLNALLKLKNIKDIPIVYAMVSNPISLISGHNNIKGVSMNVSAEAQLGALIEVQPKIKKIGIIYDLSNTSDLFREAQEASLIHNIEIISKKVMTPQEVIPAINDMSGKVDAIWMLPDKTVITKENLEYLYLISFQYKIPLLFFSHKYVEDGALMALSIDAYDIGTQAGGIAKKIVDGAKVNNNQNEPPRKPVLFINLRTAKKININISDKVIKKTIVIK